MSNKNANQNFKALQKASSNLENKNKVGGNVKSFSGKRLDLTNKKKVYVTLGSPSPSQYNQQTKALDLNTIQKGKRSVCNIYMKQMRNTPNILKLDSLEKAYIQRDSCQKKYFKKK